jgi:hypothetical protein
MPYNFTWNVAAPRWSSQIHLAMDTRRRRLQDACPPHVFFHHLPGSVIHIVLACKKTPLILQKWDQHDRMLFD